MESIKLQSPVASANTSPTKKTAGGSTSLVEAGSWSCPFRLAIVGGGPSGCSIIVRAVRIGMLSDLCGFSFQPVKPSGSASPTSDSLDSASLGGTAESPRSGSKQAPLPTSAGVCLFDADSAERFGGGRLQDYVINSNTWIAKFATHVIDEKPENLPPELVRGTALDRLTHMSSTREILKIGNKTGSLKSVGTFLTDVGSVVQSIFKQFPDSSRCLHKCKVTQLQQVLDEQGHFLMWKVTYESTTGDICDVYAVHVVLATGGHQEMPRFPTAAHNAKAMLSDDVCTELGIARLRTLIAGAKPAAGGAQSGSPSTGRVAIVGGSHSAFSAAWILLNRIDESAQVSADKKDDDNSDRIRLGPSSICILYRSPVKVFYATKAEAEHDHYGHDHKIVVNKVTGQINPFGGIRGDAKELWRSIRANREPRVRMLQVKTNITVNSAGSSAQSASSSTATNSSAASNFGGMKQSIVDKILDEASAIVWACGYSANAVRIVDATGRAVPISYSKGQIDVDDQARVLLHSHNLNNNANAINAKRPVNQETPVVNLYGSGLGYGLKATLENGEPDGSSGRADGVAVYLKRGATLVLGHVLGTRVFGGGNIGSWEERNKLIRKQTSAVPTAAIDGKLMVATAIDSPSQRAKTASTTPGRRSRADEIAARSPTRIILPMKSPQRPPTSPHAFPLSASPNQSCDQQNDANGQRVQSTPQNSSAHAATAVDGPEISTDTGAPNANSEAGNKRPSSAGRARASSISNPKALHAMRQEAQQRTGRPVPPGATSTSVPSTPVRSGPHPTSNSARIPIPASSSALSSPSATTHHHVTSASKTLPARSSSGIAANSKGGSFNSSTSTNKNAIVVKPKPFPLPHSFK